MRTAHSANVHCEIMHPRLLATEHVTPGLGCLCLLLAGPGGEGGIRSMARGSQKLQFLLPGFPNLLMWPLLHAISLLLLKETNAAGLHAG